MRIQERGIIGASSILAFTNFTFLLGTNFFMILVTSMLPRIKVKIVKLSNINIYVIETSSLDRNDERVSV